MSLWQDFKDSLYNKVTGGDGFQTSDLTRFTQPLMQGSVGIGSAIDIFKGIEPIRSSASEAASKSSDPFVSAVATKYEAAQGRALESVALPYRYGVARPLTTAMMAIDPGRERLTGSSLGELGNLWNASEYVSPGQEIVAGFNNYIGDKNDSSAREQVNAAIKQRQRLKEFENNWAANIVSGGSDLAFNWYLDPLNRVGQVTKEVKYARNNQSIAKETEQIAEKTGTAWETIKWLTKTGDVTTINNFLKGTNPQLARAFSQSTNESETALIWMASRGNKQAIDELAKTKTVLAREIEANRSMFGFAKVSGYPMSPNWDDAIQKEYDGLLWRDEFLANAIATARTNVAVRATKGQDLSIGTAQGLTRFGQEAAIARQRSAFERAEAKTRAAFGVDESIIPQTFYVGDGARKVTVWSKAPRLQQAVGAAYNQGSATGIFNLQGANASDGAVELQANLRSGPLRDLFTGEESLARVNYFLNAPTTGAQNAILEQIEKEGVALIAKKYGITDEATIDMVKNFIVSNKNGSVQQVLKDGKATWVDEGGEINIAPFLETQTPDTYVMLNWKEVDSAMRNAAEGFSGPQLGTRSAGEKATYAYEAFNSVWRPAVLFRLGYPVRNVSEGWFRFASVTNAMMAADQLIPGARNFAKNRKNGFIAKQFGKDIDQETQDLIDELQGHIAARLQIRGIDASAVARGEKVDLSAIGTLDEVTSELDMVHRNRQLVIEDYLKEGKYRIGAGVKSYKGVNYDDTFVGTGGRYLRELSSSERTTQATLGGPGQMVTGLSSGQVRAKVPTRVNPSDGNYVTALADVVNTQFRNSYLYQRVIRGDSEKDIAKWLNDPVDKEAAYVRGELGLKLNSNMSMTVRNVADVVERYLPDAELRLNAAVRDLTPDDISRAMSKTGFVQVDEKTLQGAQKFLDNPAVDARLAKIDGQLKDYYERVTTSERKGYVFADVKKLEANKTKYTDELRSIREIRNGEGFSSLSRAKRRDYFNREQKIIQILQKNRASIEKQNAILKQLQDVGAPRAAKYGEKIRKLEAEYDEILARQNRASAITGKPLKSAERKVYATQAEFMATKAESGVRKLYDGTFKVITFRNGQRVERSFADEKRANSYFKNNPPSEGIGQPVRPIAKTSVKPLDGPGTAYRDVNVPLNRVDAEASTQGGGAYGGAFPEGQVDWNVATVRGADGNPYTVATKGGEWKRWQPIHGKEIMDTIKEPGTKKALARQRDRIFKYIGSLPEDTLLRHPFVNVRYNQYMRQAIDDAVAQGGKDMSNAELQALSRSAREYSLREVKRTLYTIDRYTRGAEYIRFISPFFAAWENTTRTWGRIMLNDPSVAARAYQVITAPIRAGWVVDEDGVPVEFDGRLPSKEWSLQLQVPTGVADKIPGLKGHETMRFNLKSLNVVFQGETLFTPGVGPLVQIPISEAIKIDDNAATRLLGEVTLTTGVSTTRGSADLITPAWMRRALSLYMKENASDYSRDFTMLYQQRRFELQQQGIEPPKDLLERVKNETDRFYVMRTFANLILPASPQFGIKPEYQQYVDKWRQYQQQGTIEGVTAAERYRKDFPEYFAFGFSTSENTTGVTSTRSARKNAERYGSTISSVLAIPGVDPGVLGALLNNPDDTSYDQYTGAWQTNRQVTPGIDVDYRSQRSPKEAADQPYIAKGWDDFIAMDNKTKALLASKGLKSFSANGAEGLQSYRREWLAWAQRNNPAWFVSYSQRDENQFNANAQAFSRALEDPKFSGDKKNDVAWKAIGSYLTTREQLKQELASRQARGGSATLTSASNSDIAAFYTDYVAWLNRQSPRASELFTRYFDGEFGRIEQLTQQQQVGAA